MTKQRDTAIDILKGIAIILVIIGHWLTDQSTLHTYIYSFHLPLFFIISGFFFSPKPILEQIKRDAKLLLIPYLLICILIMIHHMIFGNEPFTNLIIKAFYSILATRFVETTYMGHETFSIGPAWFLPALFWIRVLFNLLYKYTKGISLGIISIGLSLLAMWGINKQITLPLAFLIGVSNLIYYYIGYLARKEKVTEKIKQKDTAAICLLVFWIVVGRFSNLSTSMQPLTWSYPTDLMIAIAGVIGFYKIVQLIDLKGGKWLKSQLTLWGRYSLVALSFHATPYFGLNNLVQNATLYIYDILNLPHIGETLPPLILSLLVPYLAILIVPKTRWGRAIFSIKK